MKKFFIILCLVLTALLLNAAEETSGKVRLRLKGWVIFDSCDTHRWKNEPSWGQSANLSYVNFDSAKCLRIEFLGSTNANGSIRTDWEFLQEDWQDWEVQNFGMSVYAQGVSNYNVKLEVKDSLDQLVFENTISNLAENQWNNLYWNVNNSTHVAKVYIQFQSLPTSYTTFYIDNMRLILSGGNTKYWDLLDGSYRWKLEKDANTYGEGIDFDPISSTNPFSGSCSLAMEWDASLNEDNYAQLVYDYNVNGGQDFSNVLAIKAKVWCSTNTAPISISCCDGSNWRETEAKTPTNANTWETMEWQLDKRDGFNWSNVTWIVFKLNTSNVSTGVVYIDDIYIFK